LFLNLHLRKWPIFPIRPLILWGLGGLFFEGFCNSPDHLVEVAEDAADLAELALLEQHGGVRLRKLAAQGVELFDAHTDPAIPFVLRNFD
jgi:hypothetical protein